MGRVDRAVTRRVGWSRLILFGWPVVATLATAVAHGGKRTALLPVFLTFTLLWPGTLAIGRVAGLRAGAIAGALCLASFLLQAALPAPVPALQRSFLARPFDDPHQSARHIMRLPVGSARWQALWPVAPPTDAYLYVMVATAKDVVDPALVVQLGGQRLGELTPATRVEGDMPGPDPLMVWHRLQVTREALEGGPPLEVTVMPLGAASFVPGATSLVGGYSLEPTVRPAPSAFFDGERWSTDPGVMLPGWPAGLRGDVRYYVELRLVDRATRRLRATFY